MVTISDDGDDNEEMALFEITTGQIGEGYVRAYVWAQDANHACDLFRGRHPEAYIDGVVKLFDAVDGPFCTDLSDEGWKP